MKYRFLAASTLLILLGFSAGVGLNLFSIEGVVHGAPGDPNPALKGVAHDATLTGDGTPAAPLGVIGGIQGGIRVIDSLGQLAGPFVLDPSAGGDEMWMLRRIGLDTFLIAIDANGFRVTTGFAGSFFHTTDDCSGARYLEVRPSRLFRPTIGTGTRILYASNSSSQVTMRSQAISDPSHPDQTISCNKLSSPFQMNAGIVERLDLPTLGLVPPFHLEF